MDLGQSGCARPSNRGSANRNDSILLAAALDDAAQRGLLTDVDTIWLDRGYDL